MRSEDSPGAPPSASGPRWMGLAMVALGLAFAVFTRHVWEDYLITFRSSRHLAEGLGLVYQPGERVHTFTSPLGTLVPAVFAVGGGPDVAGRALWGLRLVGLAALGWAVACAVRAQGGRRGGLAAAAALGAWLVLDAKVVDFSINGMESALMIAAAIGTWRALDTDTGPRWLGAWLAALQWVRPDGFILGGALIVGALALADGRSGERGALARRVARALAWSLLFYLPWLAYATAWFGSPIPNTIHAKSGLWEPAGGLLGALAAYPIRLLTGRSAVSELFAPTYGFFGGWPGWLRVFSQLSALAACLVWLWPRAGRGARMASLALLIGGIYLEAIPRSPWYYPAWEALAALALAGGAAAAWERAESGRGLATSLVRIGLGLALAVQLGVLAGTAWEMRQQERIIERGNREPLGRWLAAQARPGDRVFLEPLGYIGYYSGLKMLDYPGLAAPEVVAARHAGCRTFAQIIARLRPEWLVLRPDQVGTVSAEDPGLLARDYRLARVFDVRDRVAGVRILPGRGYLEFDAVFAVFERARGEAGEREAAR